MNCLVSLLTKKSQETQLNELCQADDQSKDEAKFWITLKRNSLETAGVVKITYIAKTGIYKKVIGMSCPYVVKYIQKTYAIIKQKCSEEFFNKCN